jgi:hypothetical protein
MTNLLLAVPILIGLMNVPSIWAQPADPKFEVASIKPNASGSRRSTFQPSGGGRLTAVNVTPDL